jgi:outer membrane protein OmpA-like peptidoglycan-associated protein
MAVNLLNKLRNELTDDVIGRIASFVGEPPANTQSAIGYALPATLGMLAQKAQTTQGVADLFGMMQRGGFDGTPEATTSTPAPDRIKNGAALIGSLFGARQTHLADLMASRAGIRPQSAMSLLAMIAPLVLNMVGREATAAGGFNASSIARLLAEQVPFIRSAAPAGLPSVLGLSSLEDMAHAAEPSRAYEATHAEPARGYDRGGGMGWLKWALPLLILGLLIWGFAAFRHREPNRVVATANGSSPVGTAGRVVLVKRRLSCGQEMEVAPNGVETGLIAFIDDPRQSPSKERWYTFDRLEFQPGSANLAPGSEAQVRNIAAILRCYPNVTLKFGGYTDNTGDPSANQRLSQARAENARQAVISEGIDGSRIEAEGYGQEHPVASNGSDDGRQRNRRIDVRVTKK